MRHGVLFFLPIIKPVIFKKTLIVPHQVKVVTINRDNSAGAAYSPFPTLAPLRNRLPTIMPKKTQRPLIRLPIFFPESLTLGPGSLI
jgi:hypothetical protein